MSRVNRSRNLSVGLKMIDRDHKEIHDLLHELHCGANQQSGQARLVSLLRQLERLSSSHFSLEEGMMTATRFPGESLHRMRHEWMLEEIRRTLFAWMHPSFPATEHTSSMLLGSHTDHVEHEDLRFDAWLDGPCLR